MTSADRIRVLHLIESDGLYGAEHVVLALARETTRDARFSPVLGCIVGRREGRNDLYERARAFGLDAIKLEVRKRCAPWDLLRMIRTLRALDAGLIHAHGYKATIAASTAQAVNGTPILATCHLWFEDSHSTRTYRALSRLEMRLYRRFRHVVAVSEPIAAILRAHGVHGARIEVIPNGIVGAVRRAPQGATVEGLRTRFKSRSDSYVLVNVGRLAEQKAQADLIQAAALLRRVHPGIQVVILGEGPLRASLEARVAALSLGDCVHLVGFAENVEDYLAIADAFVLPSLDEGLPIALLEALAAGVPVVCTAVGAIPQLVEPDVTGLVVPRGCPEAIRDAVARLIEHPEVSSRLAAAGGIAVRRTHTAEAMYERYRRVYLDLVDPA